MKITKKMEVETVLADDLVLGFRVRRSVLHGHSQGVDDGWVITNNLLSPYWHGNHKTRKEAAEALKEMYIQKQNSL